MKFPRTRDCIAVVRDASVPALVDSAMADGGWVGGTGVTWVGSAADTFIVTYSDGTYGGFLLWGSDEEADQWVSYVGNQPTYKVSQVCLGSWVISTVAFERYTLASRLAPPLVENHYVVGRRLRFSLRGMWTPEDEWTVSGDPRGANTAFVGIVIQAPSERNNQHLMLQTAM